MRIARIWLERRSDDASSRAASLASVPEVVKNTLASGIAATACDYCHTAKLPKKDAHDLNDRGNWLKAEKEKRGAKDIDVTWLKEYVEPKK